MPRPSEPRGCRDTTCDTKVILARRAFTGSWMAFEATDRPPFTDEAVGAYVLVAGQAYRPAELIEDVQVRWEISEGSARDYLTGYPWHRAHMHEVDPSTGATPVPAATTTKGHTA